MGDDFKYLWPSQNILTLKSRLQENVFFSIFNTCNNLMLKEVVQKELSRSYVLIQTKNHYICMYTFYITLSQNSLTHTVGVLYTDDVF